MKTIAPPSDAFRLLGDPVRWRLLRVLARDRLNVSEVTRVLGLAQSGASRHLRLLKDGGLVTEERRGGWAWFGLAGASPTGLDGMWAPLVARLAAADDPHGDDARLAEVQRERAERREGWDGASRPAEPGRSWAAWAQALGRLLPPQRVLHLGCGRGALTREVARWAESVVAVDPDPRALAAARGGQGRTGRITFRRAPLHHVPLPPSSFDVVLLAQALATVERPTAVLAEAARVAKPGGTVLVLDLLPHGETWVCERLGHRRQGVAAETLADWLRGAGLQDVRAEPADRRRGDPFVVLIGSGRRPETEPLARPAGDGGAL
jgi:SAM-dependent methyltransferase